MPVTNTDVMRMPSMNCAIIIAFVAHILNSKYKKNSIFMTPNKWKNYF